jgi:hypothetical protein
VEARMAEKKITELMGFAPSEFYGELEASIATEVGHGIEGLKKDLIAVIFTYAYLMP